MLAFETTNKLMDGVESAVSTYFVYDVIERFVIEEQDMRAQVNGLPADSIAVADELGIEAVQGMLQAWVRGFGMHEDNFTDRETALQEEIERKSNDLRLSTQGC